MLVRTRRRKRLRMRRMHQEHRYPCNCMSMAWSQRDTNRYRCARMAICRQVRIQFASQGKYGCSLVIQRSRYSLIQLDDGLLAIEARRFGWLLSRNSLLQLNFALLFDSQTNYLINSNILFQRMKTKRRRKYIRPSFLSI